MSAVPPPLAASMPDLLSDDSEARQRSHSVAQLSSEDHRDTTHTSDTAQTYNYVRLSHGERGEEGSSPISKHSEPLRKRVQMVSPTEELKGSSAGNTPTSHRASPLATTTYVYTKGSHEKLGAERGGGGGRGKGADGRHQKKGDAEDEAMISDGSLTSTFLPEVEVEDIRVPRTGSEGRIQRALKLGSLEALATRPRLSSDLTHTHRTRAGSAKVREGWSDAPGSHRGGSLSPSPKGRRISAPAVSLAINGHHSRRLMSEGDNSLSIPEKKDARNSLILIDAGLGFLSPDSPVLRGVAAHGKANSPTGSNEHLKAGRSLESVASERHEM